MLVSGFRPDGVLPCGVLAKALADLDGQLINTRTVEGSAVGIGPSESFDRSGG